MLGKIFFKKSLEESNNQKHKKTSQDNFQPKAGTWSSKAVTEATFILKTFAEWGELDLQF